MTNQDSSIRRWPLLVGAALIFGLVLIVSLWFIRTALAERALQHYCAKRGLECHVSITQLSLSALSAKQIDLKGASRQTRLTSDRMEIRYTWSFPTKIAVSDVTIETPVLHARLSEEGLDLDGFDRLMPDSGSGGGALPRLKITDGTFRLETPAGPIETGIQSDLSWPEQGGLALTTKPAQLSQAENHLDLERADLFIELTNSEPTIALDLAIGSATWDGFVADGFTTSLNLAAEDPDSLTINADIQQLKYGTDLSTGPLQISGEAEASDPLSLDLTSLRQTILSASLNGAAQDLSLWGHSAGIAEANVTYRIARNGLPEVSLKAVTNDYVSDIGALETATLSLFGRGGGGISRWNSTRSLIAEGASLSPDLTAPWLDSLHLGAPFEAHRIALRRGLSQAVGDFNLEMPLGIEIDLREPVFWQVTAPSPSRFTAASGQTLTLTPHSAAPGLVISPERFDLAGLIEVTGPSLPSATIDMRTLSVSSAGFETVSGGISIKPWSAGGTMLSADLNRLTVRSGTDLFHLELLGETRLQGGFFGLELLPSRLFGGVEAARGAEGWRIQTLERACLGLDLGGAKVAGDLSLKPVGMTICPEDGRFVRFDRGVPTGRLRLGKVSVPFEGATVSGTARLEEALLSWRGGEAFSMELLAEALTLPMQIGSRQLRLDSQAPSAQLATSDTTLISAKLGQTALSGSLVPANVEIEDLQFDARLSDDQLTGLARSPTVRITDYREDPIYQPMLADLSAQFAGSQMFLAGPVRLADRSPVIADTELTLNLMSLTGQGSATSRALQFSRGGLQAHHLSPRLLGVMSNTRGEIEGTADFTLDRGKIRATGAVTARDLGFDTARIGAVDGVSGTMVFSDLLALTSAPGQVFTIGRIQPGLPLEDGEVSLQLIDGAQALIESASWPLAGGRLLVDPAAWTIGGDSDLIQVRADRIELSELIELLKLPDVEADGTISGSFPIELTRGRVEVRNALLTADERGGSLKYLGGLSGDTLSTDERVRLAFNALKDFQFDVLQLGVNGNLLGDLILTIKLLGTNPDVLGGADFDFNISLDSALGDLIQSGQSLATSSWIAKAVADTPGSEDSDEN